MDSNNRKNIADIVDLNQCTGCGTCSSFCPTQAITIELNDKNGIFLPIVNSSKCTSCGICTRICPGSNVNFDELNQDLFGSPKSADLLGNFDDCFVGSITDINLRESISSGGIASGLLLYALENKIINGALVTKMKDDDPTKPQIILARTLQEIKSSIGSKYCPCPIGIGLKEVLSSESSEKFAVVGLPCHIHAIRKAQIVFPELKQKIPLTIGLFCAHATSFQGTDILLRKLRVSPSEVRNLTYRGYGQPGRLSVEGNDGKLRKLPLTGSFKSYYPLFDSYFFVPWRCLFCQDHFNTLADISLGDAWLPEYKKKSIGQSLIIVRTNNGHTLVKDCAFSGSLSIANIKSERVISSQSGAFKFKSNHWQSRLNLARHMGKQVPSCELLTVSGSSTGSYIINIFRLKASNMAKGKTTESLLSAIPLWVYRFYNVTLSILSKIP